MSPLRKVDAPMTDNQQDAADDSIDTWRARAEGYRVALENARALFEQQLAGLRLDLGRLRAALLIQLDEHHCLAVHAHGQERPFVELSRRRHLLHRVA